MQTLYRLSLSVTMAILLGCATHSTSLRVPNQALDNNDISEKLDRLVAKRIQPLDRSMVTFRYESRALDMKSLADAQKRLSGWSERFFDPAVTDSNMVGPGTYIAIDPAGSRSFGGNDPQLFVIPLRKGSRLIDARQALSEADKAFLIDMKQRLNCTSDSSSGRNLNDMTSWIGYLRNNKTLECRQQLINTFSRNRVEAILYPYSAAEKLTTCRPGQEVALNVIASPIMDLDRLVFFSDTAQFGGGPIQNHAIYRLYVDAAKDFSLQMSDSSSQLEQMPKTLRAYEKKRPFAHQWKATKIGRCGKTWSIEENPTATDKLVLQMKESRQNDGLREQILATAKAYQNMKHRLSGGTQSGSWFSMANLKAMSFLSFQASGLPQDDEHFQQWLKARAALNQFDPSSTVDFAAVGKWLEEDETGAKLLFRESGLLEKLAVELLVTDAMNPHLIWRLSAKGGGGPRMRLMMVNQIVGYFGGAPYFIAPLPADGDPATPSQITREAQLTIEALKTCQTVYEQAKSFDEVQQGNCGVLPD